ncbi:hypothetical protein STXM2123_1020 [Streptomyces sp. F-3]|nr:hypothetical protein STXM2123_1020 [Streptomyces sp. F-3]
MFGEEGPRTSAQVLGRVPAGRPTAVTGAAVRGRGTARTAGRRADV